MASNRRLPPKNSSYQGVVITVALILFVLFLIFMLWPEKIVASMPKNHPSRLLFVQKTLAALERAVDHLVAVGDGVNLDAVFGLRLVEDQLRAFRLHIVAPYEKRVRDGDLTLIIGKLVIVHDKAREYRQQLTKIVQRNQPEYYKRMSFVVVDGNWELWYPQRDVDRSSMSTYGVEKTVDEKLRGNDSDECMMESYFKQCQFTKKCWDRMSRSRMNGYSLTHESIFIMASLAFGCRKEVDEAALKWSKMSSEDLLVRQFAAVLHEAEMIANANFPSYQRDLFLEQVSFGGVLGYKDFFRDEWLEQILSWQDAKGCFALNYNATIEDFRRDFPNRTTPFINLRAISPSLVKYDGKAANVTDQPHHRQKRTEVILEDGCWAHMTAVGMAALGQYIRHLLEPTMRI